MRTINEIDVINNISNQAKLLHFDAKRAYLAIIKTIEDGLSKHYGVRVAGLGAFLLRYYKSRKGHNPKTGKSLILPGHYFPSFKASAKLKRYVNK